MNDESKPICKNCRNWTQWGPVEGSCEVITAPSKDFDRCRVYDDSEPITTEESFGCVHFQGRL